MKRRETVPRAFVQWSGTGPAASLRRACGGTSVLPPAGSYAALGRAAARMLRHVVGLGWLGAGFMRASRGAHADVGGMARGSGWAERARWTHAEARMAL